MHRNHMHLGAKCIETTCIRNKIRQELDAGVEPIMARLATQWATSLRQVSNPDGFALCHADTEQLSDLQAAWTWFVTRAASCDT